MANPVIFSTVLSQTTPVFSVDAYGAAGDGATDDTLAIQRALDACRTAGGGTVEFSAKTYRVATNLTYFGNNLRLIGAGQNATQLLFDDTPLPQSPAPTCIQLGYPQTGITGAVTGTVGSPPGFGAFTVQLPNGAGVAASPGYMLYVAGPLPYGSLMARIESIATDTLTLSDSIPMSFVATTAYTIIPALAAWITVADLQITVNATTPSRLNLITVLGVGGLLCERISFLNAGNTALSVATARNVHVKNCRFERCGQTVQLTGCTSATIDDCFFSRSQWGPRASQCTDLRLANCAVVSRFQGFGIPSLAAGNANGFRIENGCPGAVILGNLIQDHGHGNVIVDSPRVTMTGNTITNVGDSTEVINSVNQGPFQYGVQICGSGLSALTTMLSDHCTVTGNTFVKGTGVGVVIGGVGVSTNASQQTFCSVTGNTIAQQAAGGVLLWSSRNSVQNNMIENYGSGQTGVLSIAVTSNNAIGDNLFSNGLSGKAFDTSASAGSNYLGSNIINGEATATAGSDIVRT